MFWGQMVVHRVLPRKNTFLDDVLEDSSPESAHAVTWLWRAHALAIIRGRPDPVDRFLVVGMCSKACSNEKLSTSGLILRRLQHFSMFLER